MDPDDLAAALGALGYEGFVHLARPTALVNPGELLIRALAHDNLDVRLVEGLPWLIAGYPSLDWDWLVGQAVPMRLQNRLGYLVELAVALPTKGGELTTLREVMDRLNHLRLPTEGTLCRDSMPDSERNWVRGHRNASAVHWNLLTTLTVDSLTHAA
jgi:hypothetical protein